VKTDLSKPLTRADAHAFVTSIKSRIGDIRGMIVELHDRLGWKVLGYDSWDKCVKAEFADEDLDRIACHRQIRTARLGASVLAIDNTLLPKRGGLKVGHARATEGLATDEDAVTAIAAAAADAIRNGKQLTSKAIRAKAKALDLPLKKAKADAPPVGAEDAEEPVGPVEEPPQDPALLDALDNPVPDDVREIFEDRKLGEEAISALRKADNLIKRYSETRGGFFCSHKASVVRLREDKAAIAASLPHSICTDCVGDGCNACMGHRFLLKSQLDGEEISPNQKKLLQRRGVEIEGMTKKEASRRIDDIAREEDWKPREDSEK